VTNAAESLCKVTTFSYAALTTNDVGNADFYSPRSTLVKVLGYTNSLQYLLVLPGERREIQGQSPGAAWDNANNLVTTNKFMIITNGTTTNLTLVQNYDGTARILHVTTNNGVKVEFESTLGVVERGGKTGLMR
jgi:hypothetical protein